jgi:AAA+ superfamily predicted ATPase
MGGRERSFCSFLAVVNAARERLAGRLPARANAGGRALQHGNDLDEFDALARTHADAAEHNELRRVVNSLLLLIERFKGPGLVIAATNLPQFLDEAVWRRFDEIVSFEAPGEREIGQLLARQFANFPANFALATLIGKLAGMSYADIERVCVDGIKKAVLKKRKSVSETEFAAALRQEARRKGLTSRRST